MSKVITPEAIISYPAIFETDKNGKFGCALVFPAGTDLSDLKQAAFQVVVDKFGEPKAKEMLKKGQFKLIGGSHHTFRTDKEEEYGEGAVFINARGTKQPGVVSRIPDPRTGKPMAITDPEEIYPGAVVRASVSPFWYDKEGNKGVAWGLNNLQKIRDGERLDGRSRAEDEFAADESAVASLEDLVEGQEDLTGISSAARGRAPANELAELLG